MISSTCKLLLYYKCDEKESLYTSGIQPGVREDILGGT